MVLQLALGLVLSSVIGIFSYWRGSLTQSGIVGATLVGTAIFGFGGLLPALLLVAFFVSSSALSTLYSETKNGLSGNYQKGGRRDFAQALANGGWAAILAIGLGISGNQPIFLSGFIGAIAAVTADTWATEIGVSSRIPPRMITSGRIVAPGTSGAVTMLGTFAAMAGGIFIGAVAALGSAVIAAIAITAPGIQSLPPLPEASAMLAEMPHIALGLILLGGIAGLAGALFDSALGATVQAAYFCEYDEVQTERRVHSCGRETRLLRGWKWLDNDAVNFLASVFGSVTGFLFWLLFFQSGSLRIQ